MTDIDQDTRLAVVREWERTGTDDGAWRTGESGSDACRVEGIGITIYRG